MGPGKGSVALASISCVLSWIGATWAGVTSVLSSVKDAADVCRNIECRVNPDVVTCDVPPPLPPVDSPTAWAPIVVGVLVGFIVGVIACGLVSCCCNRAAAPSPHRLFGGLLTPPPPPPSHDSPLAVVSGRDI